MRKAFKEELDRQHFPLELGLQSDLKIQITEGPSLVYLIATVSVEKNEMIASVSIAKGQFSATERTGTLPRLERQLLWQQPEAILDVAQSESPSGNPELLLVLGKTSLFLYRRNEEAWLLKDSSTLPRLKPQLRDVRGEIHLDDHFFQFHLPGVECDGDAWQKLAFECEEREGIWRSELDPMLPFSLDPGRNFFAVDPHYIGPKKFPLAGFFSAARSYDSRHDYGYQMTLAGADGHTYIYPAEIAENLTSESLERVPVEWGSDLVSLSVDCRDGFLVLATGSRDYSSRDTLQGFEFDSKAVLPVTSVTEFPGPILALRAEKNSAAIVIAFNLTTGNYEAYRVTMACDD